MKHFCHMLEARLFVIITYPKPITYAFQQKREKCSPRQFTHLDFIAKFTTDIWRISEENNVVADSLSLSRRVSHFATILWCTGRNAEQRQRASNNYGVNHGSVAWEATNLWHQVFHVLWHVCTETLAICSSSSTIPNVPGRPWSVAPRQKGNSEAFRTLFHVAKNTEGSCNWSWAWEIFRRLKDSRQALSLVGEFMPSSLYT
jgi:hypothetical protein